MSRVEPWHQTNWDWRAAGNFIGGGTGTGLMIATTVSLAAGALDPISARIMAFFALGFVGLGLLCVWAEIGKPLRFMNVFRQPKRSWMTREAYMSVPLMGAGFLAVVLGDAIWFWLAGLIAVAYLFCQMKILQASKGIPTWRDNAFMPVTGLTGLTEGLGFLILAMPVLNTKPAFWQGAVLLVLVIARAVSWWMYRNALNDKGAPEKALAVLTTADRPVLYIGNALPAVLLVIWSAKQGPLTATVAGAVALLGGWFLKFTVIARSAYNQGFALPKLPVRGVGTPAPGIKPGWSKGSQ